MTKDIDFTDINKLLKHRNELIGNTLYKLASSHHEHLGKYIVTYNKDLIAILNKYELNPTDIGEIFTGEIGSRNMVYSQLLYSSLDADRLECFT